MKISEYFQKMKALGDEMASAGRPLQEEELVQYILAGLDMDFNPIVSAVLARTGSISIGELYTQLLSFEQRLDLFFSWWLFLCKHRFTWLPLRQSWRRTQCSWRRESI